MPVVEMIPTHYPTDAGFVKDVVFIPASQVRWVDRFDGLQEAAIRPEIAGKLQIGTGPTFIEQGFKKPAPSPARSYHARHGVKSLSLTWRSLRPSGADAKEDCDAGLEVSEDSRPQDEDDKELFRPSSAARKVLCSLRVHRRVTSRAQQAVCSATLQDIQRLSASAARVPALSDVRRLSKAKARPQAWTSDTETAWPLSPRTSSSRIVTAPRGMDQSDRHRWAAGTSAAIRGSLVSGAKRGVRDALSCRLSVLSPFAIDSAVK